MMRKWLRRSLWLPLIGLGIYALVIAFDAIWFRFTVPVAARDSNWSGHWRTERHRGFRGRLLVKLPDPLPEGQDFKADAFVYYPVYCPYRLGRFMPMTFTGHFTPDAPTSAGRSANFIPSGGKLKFKGEGEGGQTVEYTALIATGRHSVVGGYLSKFPNDEGTFFIERE